MTATLKITDGTTEISLLRGEDGFFLNDWIPQVAQYKGGGVFQSSPLSDGRRLVTRQFDNVVETFDLKAEAESEDGVILRTQELRRLLEKAVNYWATDWQNEPVWIEAQATCETNARYAYIHWYSTPTDDNPYAQPFLQDDGSAVLDDWLLLIERGHWQADEPESSTCVELSGMLESEGEGDSDIFYPVSGTDDAMTTDLGPGSIDLTANNLYFGGGGGIEIWTTGVRFRNVDVPRGALIISSFMRGIATVTDGVAKSCTIEGEDNGSPATFSTYADFTGRVRTAAAVVWAIPAFVTGNQYDTPDLSTIIQEIINRADWVQGSDIVIFLESIGTAGGDRIFASLENPTYNETELHIEWRMFGREATCENEVYIANKQNEAQLTHLFVDNGGVFGANQIGAALPFDLLPAVPAANDAVYFGIDTTTADSGPFCSLVFDILTIHAGNLVRWEYWNGGAWAVLTVQDNTNNAGAGGGLSFDTAGVGSVHWRQPADWATTAVNGVTGYWVRLVVLAGGGNAPSQQNRDVYTIVWPYVDVDENQAAGDIPAITKALLRNVSDDDLLGAGTLDLYESRVMVGLRSLSRGESFAAYINCADEQNPSGITVAVGTDTIFTNDVTAPTGRIARVSPTFASAAFTNRLTITIGATLAPEYYGTFHAFLRCDQNAGALGDFAFQLDYRVGAGTVQRTTQTTYLSSLNDWQLVDFGKITVVPSPLLPDEPGSVIFRINVSAGSTTPTLDLYDLILLPVDEWAGDFSNPSAFIAAAVTFQRTFSFDSIENRKVLIRSIVETDAGEVSAIYTPIANSASILQSNADQRLWFLMHREGVTGGVFDGTFQADPYIGNSVQMFANSRYLSMRGAR